MKKYRKCWLCTENLFELNKSLDLPSSESLILDLVYSLCIIDISPIVKGHMLIFPKRHVENLQYLRATEKSGIIILIKYIRKILNGNVIFYSHISNSDNNSCMQHLHFHALPCNNSKCIEDMVLAERASDIEKCTENFIISYINNELIYTSNNSGNSLRKNIENSIGGDTRKWTDRLSDDETLCAKKIYESINFLEIYK